MTNLSSKPEEMEGGHFMDRPVKQCKEHGLYIHSDGYVDTCDPDVAAIVKMTESKPLTESEQRLTDIGRRGIWLDAESVKRGAPVGGLTWDAIQEIQAYTNERLRAFANQLRQEFCAGNGGLAGHDIDIAIGAIELTLSAHLVGEERHE